MRFLFPLKKYENHVLILNLEVNLVEFYLMCYALAVVFVCQEFNIEKLQLVEAEKKKIRLEYERKEKQVDVRKKM